MRIVITENTTVEQLAERLVASEVNPISVLQAAQLTYQKRWKYLDTTRLLHEDIDKGCQDPNDNYIFIWR